MTFRLLLTSVIFFISVEANAATSADFEAFKLAMIDMGCAFDSTMEAKKIQQKLGWGDGKFSEVMLWLALRDKFVCPGGCYLVDPRCPNRE